MDDSATSIKVSCYQFTDHVGRRAVGVICFTKGSKSDLDKSNRQHLKQTYTSNDYPCFQIYVTSSRAFLDNPESRPRAIAWIARILSHLKTSAFFATFSGIRFELYNGCPAFRRFLISGQPNRKCLKAISLHAEGEREYRNTVACLKGAIREYSSKNYIGCYFKRRNNGATQDELLQILAAGQKLTARICEIAAMVSPEVAHFNQWQSMHDKRHQRQRDVKRRRTLSLPGLHCPQRQFPFFNHLTCKQCQTSEPSQPSFNLHGRRRTRSLSGAACPSMLTLKESKQCADLDNSTTKPRKPLSLKAMPARQAYLSSRLTKMIGTVVCTYNAPFMPNSFYSPDHQPWHSVVVLLTGLDLARDRAFILRFNKDPSDDDPTGSKYSYAGNLRCKLQAVSTCPNDNTRGRQPPSLSALLAYHLHILGLGESSTSSNNIDRDTGEPAAEFKWFEQQDTYQQDNSLRDNIILREELENLGLVWDSSESDEIQCMPATPESEMTDDHQHESSTLGSPISTFRSASDADMVI